MNETQTEQEKSLTMAAIKKLGKKIAETRINDRLSAYESAQELYKLSESIGHELGMAEAKVMFASQAYFRENDTKRALQYLEEALIVLKDSTSYSLAWLYILYGNVYWRMGDFDLGFEYAHKSVELSKQGDIPSGVAWTSYILGSFYVEMKQYEQAHLIYSEALDIFEQIGDLEGFTSTLGGLGNIATARKEYTLALEYYEKALPCAQKNDLPTVEARMYNDIGVVYEQQNNYPLALSYLQKAYDIRVELQNILGMSSTELNLGRIYTTLNDYPNALFYYQKSVESTSSIMANPRLQRAYQGLAEVYKLLDKSKEALAYYEKYMEIYTIVMGEENEAKHASLEAKHDLEIHKLKNIELKKANDLIAQQNTYIIEEKLKSEKLLLNILPEEVADELKEKGYATPHFYDQTTILFTDFKGFTNLVELLPPQEVIEELNTCFLAFDEICEQYNLEKIKTIGDSYMAVAGIPVKNDTNAIDAVRAGLAMQAFMAQWIAEKRAKNLPVWELRLGIHTGCVIAGVIGKNKFAYDVWGDAVNIASRMESSGEANKVNISQTTYELVKDKFVCEPRGKIQAKNKGEVEMYFVLA